MIPIGGIVAAALAAGRMGRRGRRPDPRVGNVLVRVILLFPVLVVLGLVRSHGRAGLILVLVLLAALSELTIRLVIRLGLPRLTYRVALVTPPVSHSEEVRGGAVLAAALTLGRKRAVDLGAVAWLDRRLARAAVRRILSMTAAGLLAAARGKKETARLLFHGIHDVSRRAPARGRGVARSWLVADAATRGDWTEVVALARPGFLEPRWPRVMGAIARRLLRDPAAPSDRALVLSWLAAPHRVGTWPLVRRALATPRGAIAPAPSPVPPAQSSGDPLDVALRAHAACLALPGEASLLAAGRAWDAARASPTVLSLLARRALALEADTSPELARERLVATVEEDLSSHAARLPSSVLRLSPTLASAASRARRLAMDEIETLAADLKDRMASKQRLPASGEWMQWGALRRACDRLARGSSPEVRRGIFVTVYGPACGYGAWLFNVRDEKLLANAMFTWLLGEARALKDTSAIALLEKNVKAGDG